MQFPDNAIPVEMCQVIINHTSSIMKSFMELTDTTQDSSDVIIRNGFMDKMLFLMPALNTMKFLKAMVALNPNQCESFTEIDGVDILKKFNAMLADANNANHQLLDYDIDAVSKRYWILIDELINKPNLIYRFLLCSESKIIAATKLWLGEHICAERRIDVILSDDVWHIYQYQYECFRYINYDIQFRNLKMHTTNCSIYELISESEYQNRGKMKSDIDFGTNASHNRIAYTKWHSYE